METDNTNNVVIPVESRMSQRLITVASMLGSSGFSPKRVADVGCDHGYISIYLVQSGIASSAIAMDVRKGPLSGAEANIRDYGLGDVITTRLSDGLKELNEGETDGLVIAGMGGKLMARILEDGKPVELGIIQAVLQPQSELSEFREYLRDRGFRILEERIVFEDGKYYFPMKVSFSAEDTEQDVKSGKPVLDLVLEELMNKVSCDRDMALSICNRFGECNIYNKDPLLKSFCEHGIKVTGSILKNLDKSGHEERFTEVQNEYNELEKVLLYLE